MKIVTTFNDDYEKGYGRVLEVQGSFLEEHGDLLFTCVIVVIMIIGGLYKHYSMSKSGVYTIAVAKAYDGVGFLDVYYQGKIYQKAVEYAGGSPREHFVFVRIFKGEPLGEAIPVEKGDKNPDCLARKPLPLEGWEKWEDVPACE